MIHVADPIKLKYCVDGEWLESKTDKYMDVTDSSTGEVFALAPCCTASEVEDAINSAHQAYLIWSNMPVQKRTQVLFHWKTLLEQHTEELAYITSRELGKNLDEARGEIVKIIEGCEVGVAAPMIMKGESLMNVSTGHDTVSYREPLGVFAGIAPFNFPAMIPFGWMIPLAIVTGNTFVLKAASMVPTSGIRLLELLYEAGLPKGVVNFVTCSRNEAEILLTHPLVRGVSFVGSTPVGKHVYSVAAAHGKRVQAQTEAKNHGLVLADASLERAAAGIINSTFGCAGMRCMALPVCVVENKVADEFVSYLIKFAKQRVVGCSYDPKTELGPVVSAEHQAFVKGWITKGVEEGAELLLDGRDLVVPGFEGGFFVGPTIFDKVTEDMTVGRDEIFGPVLLHQARGGLRRGHHPHEQQPLRERLLHLHRIRLLLPRVRPSDPRRYGGRERRHPGAGQLLPVCRPQGLVLRREPRVRPGRHPLLHRDQVRDHPLVHRSRQEGEEGQHLGGHRRPLGRRQCAGAVIGRAAVSKTSGRAPHRAGPGFSCRMERRCRLGWLQWREAVAR